MLWVLLDYLHALARLFERPVGLPGIRVHFAQRGEPLRGSFEDLPDEIFRELYVVPAKREHWKNVFRIDGTEEVQIGSMFEKLRGKAGVRPEQHRYPAFDVTSVQMGYRHGRRTDGSLAIHLCVVALSDRGIVASQPDSTHRKSRIAVSFRNTRLLQKRQ